MSNLITITGNVGLAPEVRETKDGRKYTVFTVADNKRVMDQESGEKKELYTNWFMVKAYGSNAGEIAKTLKVGSFVTLTGEVRTYQKDDTSEFGFEILLKQIALPITGPQLNETDAVSTTSFKASGQPKPVMPKQVIFPRV